MDYNPDIQKFADAAYVIERPSEPSTLADHATTFMAKKGLRMSFRTDSNQAEVANTIHKLVPASIETIRRDNGAISKRSETPSLTVSSRPSRSGAPANLENSCISSLMMVGHSICGRDQETSATFAALLAIKASFDKSSISSLAKDIKSWGYDSVDKDSVAETINLLLQKAPLIKGQLDQKDMSLEDFGVLAFDFTEKYGQSKRVMLASLSPEIGFKSGSDNNSFEANKKQDDGFHFKVHEFGSAPQGPSYLSPSLFNKATLKEIQGLHPELLQVVQLAREISKTPFEVVPGNGGIRSQAEQKHLKHAGKSHATFGRHTVGYAIDLVPVDKNGRVNFNDAEGFEHIRSAMEAAANKLGIPIQWGGNWKRLVDKPHFELDRLAYPVPGDKNQEAYVAETAFR